MSKVRNQKQDKPPPQPNPTRERRILAAARDLVIRYGYDKTTVSDVAEAAGISKGAIYLHFESKEALFQELVYDESEQLINNVLTEIDNRNDVESFFDVYRFLLQMIADNPVLKALMTGDHRVLGDLLRHQRESQMFKMGTAFSHEFIAKLQAQGVIRDDLTPQQVLYLLNITGYGLMVVDEYLLPEETLPLDEVSPTLAEFLDRGLSPPGGGNRAFGKETLIGWVQLGQQMLALRKQEQNRQNSTSGKNKGV